MLFYRQTYGDMYGSGNFGRYAKGIDDELFYAYVVDNQAYSYSWNDRCNIELINRDWKECRKAQSKKD